MKSLRYKTIGILGGMGPDATADLYKRIILIFQKKFGAIYHKDYPKIIIASIPIPDVLHGFENKNLTADILIDNARLLEKAGSDFICMPCNTMHVYLDKIRKSIRIPVISIMEEVASLVKHSGFKKVGLLSTKITRDLRLYDRELGKGGVDLIHVQDKEQLILTALIKSILGGKINKTDKRTLLNLVDILKNKGAEAVILGCTEFPLIVNQEDCDIKLIDTIQVLADACVRESVKSISN